MELARRVLLASKGKQNDEIRTIMLGMIESEQKQENTLMTELFDAQNISWKFRSSGSIDELDISIGPHSLNAGSPYRIPIVMYNSSSQPIHQVLMQTKARTRSGSIPWEGQWLAVGDFAPRERKVIFLEDKLPIHLDTQIERLGVTVYAQEQKRELPKNDIFIDALSMPHVQVGLQYEPSSQKGEGKVRVSLDNKTGRDVGPFRVRFYLPNNKEVEFLSESNIKVEKIGKSESLEQVFSFSHKIPIENLDKIKVEINIEKRGHKFSYQEHLSNLIERQDLEMPLIKASFPTQVKTGQHELDISITDDGTLSQSTVWLNGEKIAWTEEEDSWKVPVELEVGYNTLIVEAVDNHGLKQKHYLYVEGIE